MRFAWSHSLQFLLFFHFLPPSPFLVRDVRGCIPEPPVAITAQHLKQTLLTTRTPSPFCSSPSKVPAPHPPPSQIVHSIISFHLGEVFFIIMQSQRWTISRGRRCVSYTDKKEKCNYCFSFLLIFKFPSTLDHKKCFTPFLKKREKEKCRKGKHFLPTP